MLNRAEAVQSMRDKYLAGEMTHDAYFIWLSEFLHIECPELLIEASTKSTDPYLNDIPLSRWDGNHFWVRSHASGIPWSLSNTVCCLKSLARRAVAMRKAARDDK